MVGRIAMAIVLGGVIGLAQYKKRKDNILVSSEKNDLSEESSKAEKHTDILEQESVYETEQATEDAEREINDSLYENLKTKCELEEKGEKEEKLQFQIKSIELMKNYNLDIIEKKIDVSEFDFDEYEKRMIESGIEDCKYRLLTERDFEYLGEKAIILKDYPTLSSMTNEWLVDEINNVYVFKESLYRDPNTNPYLDKYNIWIDKILYTAYADSHIRIVKTDKPEYVQHEKILLQIEEYIKMYLFLESKAVNARINRDFRTSFSGYKANILCDTKTVFPGERINDWIAYEYPYSDEWKKEMISALQI